MWSCLRSCVQYVPELYRLIREFPCSATARNNGLRPFGGGRSLLLHFCCSYAATADTVPGGESG